MGEHRLSQDPYSYRMSRHQAMEDLENKELTNKLLKQRMRAEQMAWRDQQNQMRQARGGQGTMINQASPGMMLPSATNYWTMGRQLEQSRQLPGVTGALKAPGY